MGLPSLAGDMSGPHPPIPPIIPPLPSFMLGDTFTVLVNGRPAAAYPAPLSVPPFLAITPMASFTTIVMGKPVVFVGCVGMIPGPYLPAPIVGPGASTVLMQ